MDLPVKMMKEINLHIEKERIKLEVILPMERVMGWQVVVILALFAVAAYTDATQKKIYNHTSGALFVFNLFYFVLYPLLVDGDWKTAGNSLLGGGLAFLTLLIPAAILLIQMGGDIKFAGAAGLALGGVTAITWLFVAAALIGVVGAFKVKFRKGTLWDTLPFAPFFLASFVILLIAYQTVIVTTL